jgi:ATP-dependent Lhr-like helicase
VLAEVGSGTDTDVAGALWDLVFAGRVSSDTLAPLRARLAGGRTTHRPRSAAPRVRMRGPSGLALLSGRLRAGQHGDGGIRRGVPPSVAGRWSLVPEVETDSTVRTHASAEVLLDRHGVVTRGAVTGEGVPGGFAAVYRVLSAMEETGRVRRGYFVEGLGAAQFATAGAVDRVRGFARPPDTDRPTDDPNPYGAALDWPEPTAAGQDQHRPSRRAGALTVLVDGGAALFAERGGRTMLSFTEDRDVLAAAAAALAERVRSGRISSMIVSKVDGVDTMSDRGPTVQALTGAGFTLTPRGLRLRSTGR